MKTMESAPSSYSIQPIGFSYLRHLTDEFGVWQHSKQGEIDATQGYALDDSARALLVAAVCDEVAIAKVAASFLDHACCNFPRPVNFFSGSGEPLEKPLSDDAIAEAWWGLSVAHRMGLTGDQTLKHIAPYITNNVVSLRARAYVVLAATKPDDIGVIEFRDQILAQYTAYADDIWCWPENELTYANAIFPAALAHVGVLLNDDRAITVATKMMRFLNQTCSVDNVPIAIGNNGWFKRGEAKALWDQQPIDPAYQVFANCLLYSVTEDQEFLDQSLRYLEWFWGNNLNGTLMLNLDEESCYDGLSQKGRSNNRGSENIICYLLAQSARNEVLGLTPPRLFSATSRKK